eukprot:432618-Rhodomonas_salina.1
MMLAGLLELNATATPVCQRDGGFKFSCQPTPRTPKRCPRLMYNGIFLQGLSTREFGAFQSSAGRTLLRNTLRCGAEREFRAAM